MKGGGYVVTLDDRVATALMRVAEVAEHTCDFARKVRGADGFLSDLVEALRELREAERALIDTAGKGER